MEINMKKRLFASLLLAVVLIATMAMPAIAEEQSVGASVSVGEVISISLADAGSDSVNFAGGTPPITEQGDTSQLDGTPAVTITVGSETNVNVDISIKGEITGGSLALTNWLYSKDFAKTGITGLTDTYALVYDAAIPGSVNDFYHWITIPDGTPAGSHAVTISYQALADS
jgi:hypothetical protein